jgi:DNA-binding HxlR family transcriptional regulator
VGIALDVFGDRWSLLIVRDMMVRGLRTFKDFLESGEGIATNVLTERLRRLESAGIVTAEREAADARRVNYRLTEKGIDLAPVLLELLSWGARHERTLAPCRAPRGRSKPAALVEEVFNSLARPEGEVMFSRRRHAWHLRPRDAVLVLPRSEAVLPGQWFRECVRRRRWLRALPGPAAPWGFTPQFGRGESQ